MKKSWISYIVLAMALVMALGGCQQTVQKLADEAGFSNVLTQISDFEADTAGGSLKAVVLTEGLLAFAEKYDPKQNAALKAAADLVLSNLAPEKIQAISDNLAMIDGVAQDIFSKGNGIAERAAEAGVTLKEGGYSTDKYAAVKKVLDESIAAALKK